MSDEELELAIFSIISNSGEAKYIMMSAVSLAREGKIAEARNKIKEAEQFKKIANSAHTPLIQNEAQDLAEGKKTNISLLLVHAEDQMMSTETIGIFAEEIINLYEKIFSK